MLQKQRANLKHHNTEISASAFPSCGPDWSPDVDTERVSPRYSDIDLWDSADILEALIEGQFVAVAAVRAARPALQPAGHAIETRRKSGGRLGYARASAAGRPA